jgi:MFS family permease
MGVRKRVFGLRLSGATGGVDAAESCGAVTDPGSAKGAALAQVGYRRRRWTTFDALRDRNYRWLWIGSLASSATFQMGTVAQGWLVYELTGSAFALGWVSSGWAISSLILSLYGGAIADRVDKRDLLIWTRLAMIVNTLALAVLISTGAVRLWHLVANSMLSGVLFSFMMPASQAIVADLVDRDTLLNAVSLNSVGMGLMGIFSAAVAGYLIQAMGAEGAYYVMAAFYVVALFTLTRIPRAGQGERSLTSVWADLWEGVRYMGAHATLPSLLGLTMAWTLLGMSYRTFMPKYAQDVMGMDASGLGILMAAPGVGGLISSLVTASLGNFQGKGRLLMISGVLFGLFLVLFGNVPYLAPVLLLLVAIGAAGNACMVSTNCLLQTHAEERMRGRVMSVYMMTWGLMPLGTLPAGALADRTGVPLVVTLQGALLAAVFVLVGIFWPRLRRLE